MTLRHLRDFFTAVLLAVPTLALARPDAPPPVKGESVAAAEIVVARDAYDDRYARMRQSPFG